MCFSSLINKKKNSIFFLSSLNQGVCIFITFLSEPLEIFCNEKKEENYWFSNILTEFYFYSIWTTNKHWSSIFENSLIDRISLIQTLVQHSLNKSQIKTKRKRQNKMNVKTLLYRFIDSNNINSGKEKKKNNKKFHLYCHNSHGCWVSNAPVSETHTQRKILTFFFYFFT